MQRCCVYSKASFPVRDEVPCEIGICGIMCLDKSEAIRKYESKNPEEVGFNQVKAVGGPVTAEVEEVADPVEETEDAVKLEAVPCEMMVKRF